MIVRKPYAFLIKYFRQIHILLLLFSGYIYYKVTNLHSFINGYIETEVYNPNLDSIKNYVSPLLYFTILLLLLGTTIILILLHQKKKPKLSYVLICVEYAILFVLFLAASSYFNTLHDSTIHSAQIRLIRDFLTIFSIPQFVVFVLLIIRILGIDLQRFGFLNDEEFLQASEEDREEIEVGLNIDKDVYINKAKAQLRYFKYYYYENRFILNIIIGIFSVLFIFSIIRFGLSFKTYKQGKNFYANGYTITLKNVYTSKYSSSGQIIEKDKSFILLDLAIENKSGRRVMNTDDFILMNNQTTVTPTTKYNNYFKDLGTPYAKTYLTYQGKYNYLLIYRVDEKFIEGKYTLYYTSNSKNIKIKINPKDYSVLNQEKEYHLKENVDLNNAPFSIEEIHFLDTIHYLYDQCNMTTCSVVPKDVLASSLGSNISFLQLNLDSESYTGYTFYEFLKSHAKIKYTMGTIEKELEIKSPMEEKYKGDSTYLVVNRELSMASHIFLSIHVRNNQYKYYLK